MPGSGASPVPREEATLAPRGAAPATAPAGGGTSPQRGGDTLEGPEAVLRRQHTRGGASPPQGGDALAGMEAGYGSRCLCLSCTVVQSVLVNASAVWCSCFVVGKEALLSLAHCGRAALGGAASRIARALRSHSPDF